MSTFADANCPIARTLAVIGDQWTALILRDLFAGMTRFDAIQANLGLSRRTLAQRLAALVEHGVIERAAYQHNPPRYDYRPTAKGAELGVVLLAMKGWGDKWTQSFDAAPAVSIRHRGCAGEVEPVLSCRECGEPLTPDAIELVGELPTLAPPLTLSGPSTG
jgi:DNA-binding HxlR family transcriptional regulator